MTDYGNNAMLIPALEGDIDAQRMLADYLKENGTPDHVAEECYFGVIHLRRLRAEIYDFHGYYWGRGGGLGSGDGLGGSRRGGVGDGVGTDTGTGAGGGTSQGMGALVEPIMREGSA